MANYLNLSMCKDCGGICCKRIPGACFPSDFGTSKEEVLKNLREALRTHLYSIDWYNFEDCKRGYYVRPRTKLIHKFAEGDFPEWQLYDYSWGGECIFHTNDGCKLEPEKRPTQCRMLEPAEPHCISHSGSSKLDAYKAWKDYQEELDEI